MTARFLPSTYPGGRILFRCGDVDFGAIFPPCGSSGRWAWRFWGRHYASPEGSAGSEMAAKNAVLSQWRDFLRQAGLAEHQDQPKD